MKTFIQTFWVMLIASAIIFMPSLAYAAEITMGSDGNLVFAPNELSIAAGESVTFTNGDLPPHNMVVTDHPELSHSDLSFVLRILLMEPQSLGNEHFEFLGKQ